ncbi:hypothetical protein ICW40_17890 [Actinotalea ferrariae]|uniref:hypothetical protein n=1 Tax=Actinotalea ferrariae TaxID=1386098 RepID=UPI001C8CCDE1|nr:hypothetical protein [Actinotalea ferrariae]MBX9246665.1 hypothetical protein [Actinotalea ferrariae]
MGDVIALPLPGATALPDVRGEHRALQVTWHEHDGVFVMSTWRLGQCVASVRLAPAEAAALVAVLADGLAQCSVEAPGRPVLLGEPRTEPDRGVPTDRATGGATAH